jgi:hypothetical protein
MAESRLANFSVFRHCIGVKAMAQELPESARLVVDRPAA